jgi:hypothetical protein
MKRGSTIGYLFIGGLFAQPVLTYTVEAQENRVLQCNVKAMTVTPHGVNNDSIVNYSITIEFISDGRAIWNNGNGMTTELVVTGGQTVYILKHLNSENDGFFFSIDRRTGALYGEAPIDSNSVVEREGSCHSIRVVPKL